MSQTLNNQSHSMNQLIIYQSPILENTGSLFHEMYNQSHSMNQLIRYNSHHGKTQNDIKNNNNDEVQCPICLDDKKLICDKYNCIHKFCSVCFDKWHLNNNTCPLCRSLEKKRKLTDSERRKKIFDVLFNWDRRQPILYFIFPPYHLPNDSNI